MRILITLILAGFIFNSCNDESELVNTLDCQVVATYLGIDECYFSPAFITDKDQLVSPVNIEFYIPENELVVGSEYQIGYSPVEEGLLELGQCNESEYILAVQFICFMPL